MEKMNNSKLDPFHEIVPEKREEKGLFSNMLNELATRLRDNLLADENETDEVETMAEDKSLAPGVGKFAAGTTESAETANNAVPALTLNLNEQAKIPAGSSGATGSEVGDNDTSADTAAVTKPAAVAATLQDTLTVTESAAHVSKSDATVADNDAGTGLKGEKTQAALQAEVSLPATSGVGTELKGATSTTVNSALEESRQQAKKRRRRYSLIWLLVSAGVILALLLMGALYKFFQEKELQPDSRDNLIKLLQSSLIQNDYDKFSGLFAADKAHAYDEESFAQLRKNSTSAYTNSEYILVRMANGTLYLVSIRPNKNEHGMFELESVRQVPPKLAGLFVNLSPGEEAEIVLPEAQFAETADNTGEDTDAK